MKRLYNPKQQTDKKPATGNGGQTVNKAAVGSGLQAGRKIITALFLLAATMLLQSTTSHATNADLFESTDEFSKKFSKAITISSEHWVNLKSKWGDIHVNTHDGNELKLEARINVEAFDKESAKELLDLMTVEFSQNGDQIFLAADIRMKMDKLYCRDDEKIIWPEDGGKIRVKDYSIDIVVQMPKNSNLRVQQTYNDFHLDDLNGSVQLKMKYANVNLGRLRGANSQMDFNYTRGNIEELKKGYIEGTYSEIDIELATELDIDTRYSVFEIDEVGQLDIDDMYNEYEIGQVHSLKGDQKYGSIEIGHVVNSVNLTYTYGSVEIEDIASQFSSIRLDGKYIDFEVTMPKSNACSFELHGKHSDIDIPKLFTVDVQQPDRYSRIYEGTHGKGGGSIFTDIEYGDFDLRLRHHLPQTNWYY